METEFDKEIEALLRNGARRERTAPAAFDGRTGGSVTTDSLEVASHLDADEQNAYAENALPAATRHAYTAHLADCDDCRRRVTKLGLAAGMPSQLEQRETATTAEQRISQGITWRERLGALLSPRAWRYAISALALVLVGAVAFIVLRSSSEISSQRDTSIAQGNMAKPQSPVAVQHETHHAEQNSNAHAPTVEASPTTTPAQNPNAPAPTDQIAAYDARGGEQQPGAGTLVMKDSAPPPPAPVQAGSGVGSAAPPPAAVTGMPVPEATPMPTEEVTVASEQQAKKKAGSVAEQTRAEQRRAQDEGYQRDDSNMSQRNAQQLPGERGMNSDETQQRNRSYNSGGNVAATTSNAPTPAPRPPAAARRAPQREADKERVAQNNKSSDTALKREGPATSPAGETRTVAGRKFRRQGSAWVDTAFNPSQAVTVVKRNSEQYRALIADEPALRRIADALGGEVIVVWKGRPYRFR